MDVSPFPEDGIAIVVGANGGIGRAVLEQLRSDSRFHSVIALSRRGAPPLDVTVEETIRGAAERVASAGDTVRLIVDATGILHEGDLRPEKAIRELDFDRLVRAFAVNAIGPALLMKHFLPLLPRHGKSVFATLSARVGSITDNRAGGWYGYRASKAALNQFVRTAAIELARRHADAVCVALHPGTVESGLSRPFAKSGLTVSTPADAAARLLSVIDGLGPERSGSFLDQHGDAIPW